MTAEPRASLPASPRRPTVVVALVVVVLVMLVAAGVAWAVGRGDDPSGPVAEPWTLEPHQGLAAWVDAFDWSHALGGEHPVVDESDMEAMAAQGIQTVYLQTSHLGVPDQVVLEPERLQSLIDAAHDNGLSVVAWYLPTLADVAVDRERALASAALDVDGLAIDIESTVVDDPVERNARLLEFNSAVREALPGKAIGAITLSAVHLQEMNTNYWPDFPWVEIADAYDLILPMTYWSIRPPDWRDGERYVGENLDRIRAATGDPDIPIHVIGGIGDEISVPQVQGMLRAIEAREGVIGASLYDWATSSPQLWNVLDGLRARRPAAAVDA